MTLPEFCIKRPVFATIINVLILLVGFLAYQKLTVREYPNVSVPTLSVQTSYPNASPELVENDVTFHLEEELSGIEGVDYITSQSRKQSSDITLNFKPGTSLDRALADVRERLSRARNLLPKEAEEPIVQKQDSNAEAFLYLSLAGDNYTPSALMQYAQRNLKNPLENIKGVAKVEIMGQPYLMEVTLDPRKMMALNISYLEVLKKLEEHKVYMPAGENDREIAITLVSPLSSPEDFQKLVLRKTGNSVITLQDVATVKLTADDTFLVRVNKKPGILLGVTKTSEGNPLEISEQIHNLVPKFQQFLPSGMRFEVEIDRSEFIKASLHNVKKNYL